MIAAELKTRFCEEHVHLTMPPCCSHAGTVPVGVKPVLVFINTKSGPQKGWKLRRKFLRLLNPLQVHGHAVIHHVAVGRR